MITKRRIYNLLVAAWAAVWIAVCVRVFAEWPWLPYVIGLPAALALYWWMHTYAHQARRKARCFGCSEDCSGCAPLPRAKVRK